MLVRLFAENFGVFRDGFDLSLEAAPLGHDEDRGWFEAPVDAEDAPLRLLRMAAIYGPNGSGKSTVIQAARTLWMLVVRSASATQEGDPIPGYDPFRLDAATRQAPCTLGGEVVVDGAVFEYRISFDGRRITDERLTERGRAGDVAWFERDAEGTVTVGPALEGKLSIDLSSVTRRNAAAMSVAAQLEQDALRSPFLALARSLGTVLADGLSFETMTSSLDRLHEDASFRRWTLDHLLKPADVGISDVRTEKHEFGREVADLIPLTSSGEEPDVPSSRLEVVFSHHGVDGEGELDFAEESAGTKKMLALAAPWYDLIHGERTMFVDELSSSLHPTLLTALLDAFNAGTDGSRSQLVFTTHDTAPLDGTLRRDQVYFTEKDDRGIARLFSLADFRERSVHNIRKRYHEGRYGALPRAPHFDWRRPEAEVED